MVIPGCFLSLLIAIRSRKKDVSLCLCFLFSLPYLERVFILFCFFPVASHFNLMHSHLCSRCTQVSSFAIFSGLLLFGYTPAVLCSLYLLSALYSDRSISPSFQGYFYLATCQVFYPFIFSYVHGTYLFSSFF